MSDPQTPTPEVVPLTSLVLCQVAGCTRVARWVIVGRAGDGEALTTLLACDAYDHRANCARMAWETYNVTMVSTGLKRKGDTND